MLTTPAGETASSVEELEHLYKAIVDKKMNVYFRIQDEIEAKRTNEAGDALVPADLEGEEAEVESRRDLQESVSRRDLQGAGQITLSWNMLTINKNLGVASTNPKWTNGNFGVVLMCACFKKSANINQKSKRWKLWNWKVSFLAKRCGYSDYNNRLYKAYIYLMVATSKGGTSLGDHDGGYIKVYTKLVQLLPAGGPSGFGLKISASAWADWGPKNGGGVDIMFSIKIMGSHVLIESCTNRVKLWIYQVLPYIQITGGVTVKYRIFEFKNMGREQFLVGKITVYFAKWAVLASLAFWLTGTMSVMTKQSGSNHSKFVTKHLRTKNIYVWACCGLTYRQVYHINFSFNIKMKLKVAVFWFGLVNMTLTTLAGAAWARAESRTPAGPAATTARTT